MGVVQWVPGAAGLLAGALDRLVPRLRRTARRNLALAYPAWTERQRERCVDGVYRSIARVLLAFARFPAINRNNVREWIDYEGFEHYVEAKRRGKGVLFATAHLGTWELSAFAHALLTEPMDVVVRPLDNPYLDAWVERRRASSGNRIVGKKESARTILRTLQRNGAVGILVDQNGSLDRGAFVNFFGIAACSDLAFAKLALHSGATVLPGFAFWDEARGRHVLRFYPPLALDADPVRATQQVQTAVESAIREQPDQWLWLHRRWKTRPAGEPPLY